MPPIDAVRMKIKMRLSFEGFISFDVSVVCQMRYAIRAFLNF